MTTKYRSELMDDYDHPNAQIEYIIENVLFEASPNTRQSTEYRDLSNDFNSILLNSCHCLDACDSSTCPHGGNYIPSSDELVLNPNRSSHDLIYECSDKCNCDPSVCINRLVQYGPRADLEIITSKVLYKQYALRTNSPIPRGGFVCEYAGEIITRSEAHRRIRGEPKDNEMNYILCLNECLADDEKSPRTSTQLQTFVDPRRRGNVGRYLNHSCEPNCEIFSVRVDCPVPKVGIFAKQDIAAGQELCFHYGESANQGKCDAAADANGMQAGKSTPCLCRSINCQKVLPNLKF